MQVGGRRTGDKSKGRKMSSRLQVIALHAAFDTKAKGVTSYRQTKGDLIPAEASRHTDGWSADHAPNRSQVRQVFAMFALEFLGRVLARKTRRVPVNSAL